MCHAQSKDGKNKENHTCPAHCHTEQGWQGCRLTHLFCSCLCSLAFQENERALFSVHPFRLDFPWIFSWLHSTACMQIGVIFSFLILLHPPCQDTFPLLSFWWCHSCEKGHEQNNKISSSISAFSSRFAVRYRQLPRLKWKTKSRNWCRLVHNQMCAMRTIINVQKGGELCVSFGTDGRNCAWILWNTKPLSWLHCLFRSHNALLMLFCTRCNFTFVVVFNAFAIFSEV